MITLTPATPAAQDTLVARCDHDPAVLRAVAVLAEAGFTPARPQNPWTPASRPCLAAVRDGARWIAPAHRVPGQPDPPVRVECQFDRHPDGEPVYVVVVTDPTGRMRRSTPFACPVAAAEAALSA